MIRGEVKDTVSEIASLETMLRTEIGSLRTKLNAALNELNQWRSGIKPAATSGMSCKQALEQWERWHKRLSERDGVDKWI